MKRNRGKMSNCIKEKEKDLAPSDKEEDSFKLCGFLHAALSLKSGAAPTPGDCIPVVDFGKELVVATAAGAKLMPLHAAEEGEARRNPSDAKKRKRRGRGAALAAVEGKSILHCLETVVVRNGVRVRGIVVAVSCIGVVVLFDVYLPVAVWSNPRCWKHGPAAASVLGHLSCDWEQRRKSIASARVQKNQIFENDQRIWNDSYCHVFGCSMHRRLSKLEKSSMFDLYQIFKSFPSLNNGGKCYNTCIRTAEPVESSGIWDLPHDVLIAILSKLMPEDLLSVAATCQHLRSVAVSVMPCMNVNLFPHQQVAVEWMLEREKTPQVLEHPLFRDMLTEDGFQYFFNRVTGEVSPGIAPIVRDFKGGMFCDEPGLGKTVTALSLILKTRGMLADPPEGTQVNWCTDSRGMRCGYYEISAIKTPPGYFMTMWKRYLAINTFHDQASSVPDYLDHSGQGSSGFSFSTPIAKKARSSSSSATMTPTDVAHNSIQSFSFNRKKTILSEHPIRCTRSLSQIRRNLLETYEEACISDNSKKGRKKPGLASKTVKQVNTKAKSQRSSSRVRGKTVSMDVETNEWVQCDACNKWRKLSPDAERPDNNLAWFCSMNRDVLRQKCDDPEEYWDKRSSITYLPGFHTTGSSPGQNENINFFTNVLKDYASYLNSKTRRALNWLSELSADKLLEMETIGITLPVAVYGLESHEHSKIFEAFGLVQRKEGHGVTKWHYPTGLDNLIFDTLALKKSLTKPVDVLRIYLSKATLIVVPANLVYHWKNQILKHIRRNQVRVFVWVDHKKPPPAHSLAWDYDIVLTTFSRLSAEWSPHESSVLLRMHWLRVILDEGHTLGSSVSLTNKLQMAISLTASCRWLLTGTPAPNTPNSQVSHLQPMMKFLHDEVYGHQSKSWEVGILRPFEAEMEEGRMRLLQLLSRCMISTRKADLKTIPACIKRVKFLDFTEEHAKSYNELVATVRRNILMADWNDPSHVESLLNPKQWKFRSTTIRNVRLSCCVAGHIKVKNAGEDIQETMDILTENGVDPSSEEYAIIKHSLLNGGHCFKCYGWCRLPVVTPCNHLLCIDCVSLSSKMCTLPDCGHPYKMQSPEIRTRPENPNPKWPVPQDLIELQPSYNQDNWDPDWHATSSSKVAYLVKRLKELQKDSIKSSEKVIIFSQFLEHINVVEAQLTVAGIKFAGMYSPMHSNNKMKSLITFQYDEDCIALIMDGSAALGLDLSFATYVFLMEPIWDRSMEEQVISRAHRMGATQAINVETLAMRGTIEEQMLEFLNDPVKCKKVAKEGLNAVNKEGHKSHRSLHDFAESTYLAQLSFVRTAATTGS